MAVHRWSAIVIATIAITGCGRGGDAAGGTDPAAGGADGERSAEGGESTAPLHVAVARLESASDGPRVDGTVVFTEQEGGGVLVEANVTGLEPGLHGFHVHEEGDCGAPGFESAGGHFGLEGQRHGAPTDERSHLGDLGNIESGPSGTVRYVIRSDDLTLDDAETSARDKAVVIHAGRDDYESQPSGDSGDRIACGVIRALD
jgi:superoxide dismutase, Cu-Zn family